LVYFHDGYGAGRTGVSYGGSGRIGDCDLPYRSGQYRSMLYLFCGDKASHGCRDEMAHLSGSRASWCMGDQTNFSPPKVGFSASWVTQLTMTYYRYSPLYLSTGAHSSTLPDPAHDDETVTCGVHRVVADRSLGSSSGTRWTVLKAGTLRRYATYMGASV